MGSPRQFDRLAEFVRQHGYATAALLLPGHGGSTRDFGSSTFESWQNHVDAEVERFSRDYENIWLTGHSMGGLLAINAAARFDKCVRGIFTVACPFRITTFSAYTLRIRFRQFFSKKTDPIRVAYFSNSSVAPSPGLLLHTRKPASEIKTLMHAARNNLSQIHVPVTSVYSASDELTSIVSLDILKAELTGAPIEPIVLKDSLHAYFPEHEQIIIEQALLRLL